MLDLVAVAIEFKCTNMTHINARYIPENFLHAKATFNDILIALFYTVVWSTLMMNVLGKQINIVKYALKLSKNICKLHSFLNHFSKNNVADFLCV